MITIATMSKWDERFLSLAKLVANWSKDPSKQCGAVIVDANRRVVGIGYNGFPRGVRDTEKRYEDRSVKYKFVVHAEANAILNATAKIENCTLYVWPVPPCCDCSKLVIQSGIREVKSPPPDIDFAGRWKDSLEVSEQMLHEAGIRQTYITPYWFDGDD